MKLTPPSNLTFGLGVVLLLLGLLLRLGLISVPEVAAFWVVFVGGALLAAGAAFRGI